MFGFDPVSFVIGAAVGAVVIGVVANRRPDWFASLVTLANRIDDKINANVSQIVDSIVNKVTRRR